MPTLSVEEKIAVIENSRSFSDIPPSALPPSHKEQYYFVSYSHKDYKDVLKDILLLEERGVNIWYDSEMHIGENWQEIAQLYISKFQCKGVIFYLTENSITSPACNREVEYVLSHNKSFFSINKPLDGLGPQSGVAMLKELKRRGFKCGRALLDNFKKAFPDEVLYLTVNDGIENKARQILSIRGEELLKISEGHNFSTDEKYLTAEACRDNTIINLDLSKRFDSGGDSLNIGKIADCVFTNSVKLKKVEISDKLFEIGDSAFRNCTSLDSIDLGNVDSLRIGNNAFRNCTSLRYIDLSKIESIGDEAFSGCTELSDINKLTGRIGSKAFTDTAVKKIDYCAESPSFSKSAFDLCKTIEELTITNKFDDDLPDYVFDCCESLKKVGPFVAPWTLTDTGRKSLKVGYDCFRGCKSLEDISFVGAWDISGASSMFRNCHSLKKINLDISGTALPENFAKACENLTEVTNFTRFTSIGEEAFCGCKSLRDLDLANVISVGAAAFHDSGIERAFLKNVETIGKSAFLGARNLKSVHIGENCKSIGDKAFYGCSGLKTVKILSSDTVLNKGSNIFYGTKIKTFYVKSKSVLDEIQAEGIFSTLYALYIGEELCGDLGFNDFGFTEEESDEIGFRKFINTAADFDENGDDYDVTCSEANEPTNRPRYRLIEPNEVFGHEVMLKNVRLKQPFKCFVEQILFAENETYDDGYEIVGLTVSVHNGKSFTVDGTLIESIEQAEGYFKNRLQLDKPEELNGRYCCIKGNGQMHYCEVAKAVVPSFFGHYFNELNGKYPVDHIIYTEDGKLKAISGGDVDTVVIFNDRLEAEKIIENVKQNN